MTRRLLAAVVLAFGLGGCTNVKRTAAPHPAKTPGETLVVNPATLKSGAAPHIAWADGRRLTGKRAVLPAHLDEFAQTRQLLVSRDVDGNVFAYAPEGPVGTTPIGHATGGLAVNAERNLVAWIAPDGSPTVLQEGAAKPIELPEPEGGIDGGDAEAVLGHDCFNGPETVEGAGCSVFYRTTGAKPRSFVTSNHGFAVEADDHGRIKGLADADNDAVVGWTRLVDGLRFCSAIISLPSEDGKRGPSWTTCDHLPLAFSPDGKHLVATQPEGFEGLGASLLAVLDRQTGRPILEGRSDEKTQAFVTQLVWEDDDHLLAVVFQQGVWSIVRVGLDGSMEVAAKSAGNQDEVEDPFTLSVQP